MASSKSIASLLFMVLWGTSVVCPNMRARASYQGASATVPGQLSDDSLRQMLDGMGFEPKAISRGFLVTVKREKFTCYIQIVLSENKTKLGMNSNLGVINEPDSVTAAQWKALLVANRDVDPSFFYFDPNLKKLFLHRSIDNRGLTAAYMRNQIDTFVENLISTADLWKFTQ